MKPVRKEDIGNSEEVEQIKAEVSKLPERLQKDLVLNLLGFSPVEGRRSPFICQHEFIGEGEVELDFSTFSVSGIVLALFREGQRESTSESLDKIRNLSSTLEKVLTKEFLSGR